MFDSSDEEGGGWEADLHKLDGAAAQAMRQALLHTDAELARLYLRSLGTRRAVRNFWGFATSQQQAAVDRRVTALRLSVHN